MLLNHEAGEQQGGEALDSIISPDAPPAKAAQLSSLLTLTGSVMNTVATEISSSVGKPEFSGHSFALHFIKAVFSLSYRRIQK